jgi:hypothetical protein
VTYEVRQSSNPKAVSRELGSGSLMFNDQTMPGEIFNNVYPWVHILHFEEVLKSLVYQITLQWTKQLGHMYELQM